LFAPDRALVEKQLNCEVYDTYGCREVAMLAGECPEHAGYHISSETVLLEFVRDGEGVSAGELGEILITDLQNYGMPLIRYSVGDAGEPSDELCSCGRGLPLMKSIEGRVTDFICTADGKYISGPALTLIFSDLNVVRYQVVQRKIDQFLVSVIVDHGYSEADDLKIVSRMKTLIAPNIEVDVQHVNSIPKSSRSGKHRAIISEVPLFELD
jgi:phenylacetate-CoA ligase